MPRRWARRGGTRAWFFGARGRAPPLRPRTLPLNATVTLGRRCRRVWLHNLLQIAALGRWSARRGGGCSATRQTPSCYVCPRVARGVRAACVCCSEWPPSHVTHARSAWSVGAGRGTQSPKGGRRPTPLARASHSKRPVADVFPSFFPPTQPLFDGPPSPSAHAYHHHGGSSGGGEWER